MADRLLFPPTTVADMRQRGWDAPDFVYVSGDAYVDHPSFGAAVIVRTLEAAGYHVAVLAQPNWKNANDFKRFGRPNYGFLVSSGVIDSINGISMNIERIHGWHNVALKSELEKQLKMPVLIRNDVHLLGLVEKRLYLGDEVSDFIYVGIRSGIGSITYQHNKAMRGDKGNAGFIGHTSLDPHGPRCCCGSRGCLEAYAGQLAIMEHYAEQSGQHPDFEEIICRGKAGEPLAQSVLSEAGFYFGVALSNLIKTFEIPDVVIGGSPALADSPFMEAARSALRDYNTESLGIHLRLRMGQLPERQYALGGCYLVFDHMFSRPKLALTVV